MGRSLLNSVLDYLYREAQDCASSSERDAYSLALATIGAVRRSSSQPFNEAVFSCFGCSLPKHIQRRQEREDFFYAEFRTVSSQRASDALASTLSQRHDPATTRPEDAGQPSVGQPLGDLPTADSTDSASAQ